MIGLLVNAKLNRPTKNHFEIEYRSFAAYIEYPELKLNFGIIDTDD